MAGRADSKHRRTPSRETRKDIKTKGLYYGSASYTGSGNRGGLGPDFRHGAWIGTGEITLKSALNQPLDAEIELLEVRDLGSGEVIPSLASPEEFSKAGVDRLYYLTDLKFTPVVKPNGKSVIRVTSSKPVQEPYLNFLVQVLWPNGRLLREYTVLLDPPLYSPQAAASAPQAPVSAPRATGAPRARRLRLRCVPPRRQAATPIAPFPTTRSGRSPSATVPIAFPYPRRCSRSRS